MSLDDLRTPGTQPTGPSSGHLLVEDRATDGRTARRDRNRTAVLDAVLALFAEGHLEPAATEVAERSGVSLRSVYRYYDDNEALMRAAIAHSFERNRPLFEIDRIGEGPLVERIDRLIDRRLVLHDHLAGIARAAVARARTNELVRAQLTRQLALLRRQNEQMFAPELDDLDPRERDELEAAIELVISFDALENLRTTRNFADDQTRRILRRALLALLA